MIFKLSGEFQKIDLQLFGGRGAKSSGGKLSQKALKKDFETFNKKVYNEPDGNSQIYQNTPEGRYELAAKYSTQTANENNYFKNSVGFWDLKEAPPKKEPNHISSDRKGKVSSRYWYTKEGVYRQSDHWGSNVASCSWYIKGRTYKSEGVQINKVETAFISWEDLKAKGTIGKHQKKGDYFISGFKFKA